MTAQKKREILTGGIAALLIVCAVAARVITRGHRDAAYFLPVSLLRSFIYIALMAWWGVSLRQRIIQTQVRRYLVSIAALCVFWLSIRTVKFFFAAAPAAIRYLWYGYYFPMLFIPLLCVLVALSLRKPENYRLPKWTNLLYIPTALLLLLVLTNDLHQLVFIFPADAVAWLDTDHGYGAGYFAVMGYIALGMVTAIVTMLLKCRIPHTKITLGLPFVPVALAALYSALYICRISWIEMLAGDMTVVQRLLLAAGMESCIRCGLIQSNTGYEALFEASGIRAEITDERFACGRRPFRTRCSQKTSCARQSSRQRILTAIRFSKAAPFGRALCSGRRIFRSFRTRSTISVWCRMSCAIPAMF